MSLASKLSASQMMDPDQGQYSGTQQTHESPPPGSGTALQGGSAANQRGPPGFPSSSLPASLSSPFGAIGDGTSAAASSLGLPTHLWAALEQRWASGDDDVGTGGGLSGGALGAGGGGGGGVLLSVDDEMDRHPCMVPLVLMLERACQVQLEGGKPTQQAQQGVMPEWAASLLRVLKSDAATRCEG